MRNHETLFIHEEVMLLALRDEKGTVAADVPMIYVFGGALLAELLLANRIGIEEGSKSRLVRLIDPEPLGDPILDACLERIAAAKRRAPLRTWVSRISGMRGLQRRIAERLCDRRILRAEERPILVIFPRTVYPVADAAPKRALIERLGEAIFTNQKDIDPRTVVLLSIAHHAKLLPRVFDKRKLKEEHARIKSIVSGEMTGKATREAIEAMQAAIFVATVIPAVTVTTTSNQ